MIYESPHNVFWVRASDGTVLVTKMVGDKDVGTHWEVLSQLRYTSEEWEEILDALKDDQGHGPAYPTGYVEPGPSAVDTAPRAPKPPAPAPEPDPAPRAPRPAKTPRE